jgi:ATP-binding cassette subfamily B protein
MILAGTVRENLVWNRSGVTEDELLNAVNAAGAEFILTRPGGLDGVLSERGGTLSGGERQRIALARAFVGSPRLLILDEATSAVDVETERRIAAALWALRGTLTIVTVTHRLASVRNADRIVLLERGEVVEQGAFSELLAKQGRFAEMSEAMDDFRAVVAR